MNTQLKKIQQLILTIIYSNRLVFDIVAQIILPISGITKHMTKQRYFNSYFMFVDSAEMNNKGRKLFDLWNNEACF